MAFEPLSFQEKEEAARRGAKSAFGYNPYVEMTHLDVQAELKRQGMPLFEEGLPAGVVAADAETESAGEEKPGKPGLGKRIMNWVAEHPVASLAIAGALSLFGNAQNAYSATGLADGHHAHDGHDHDHKHHMVSGDGHHLTLDGRQTTAIMTTDTGNTVLTVDGHALAQLGNAPLVITDQGGIDTVHIAANLHGTDIRVGDMSDGSMRLNVGGTPIVLSGVENIQIGDLVIPTAQLHDMGEAKANGLLKYISDYEVLVRHPEIKNFQDAQDFHDKAFKEWVEAGTGPGAAEAERNKEEASQIFQKALQREMPSSHAKEFQAVVEDLQRDPGHQQGGGVQQGASSEHVGKSSDAGQPHGASVDKDHSAPPVLAQDKPGTFTVPDDVVKHIGEHDCQLRVTENKLIVDGKEYDTHGATKFIVGGREITTFEAGDDPGLKAESRMLLKVQIENAANSLHDAKVAEANKPAPVVHEAGSRHATPSPGETAAEVKNGYLGLSSDLEDHITASNRATVRNGVLEIDGMKVKLEFGEGTKFVTGHYTADLVPGNSPAADAHNAKVINDTVIEHRQDHEERGTWQQHVKEQRSGGGVQRR